MVVRWSDSNPYCFCHPWHLDLGNPRRNDAVGAGRLHHLEFSTIRRRTEAGGQHLLAAYLLPYSPAGGPEHNGEEEDPMEPNEDRPSLLVIDDNDDFLELIEQILADDFAVTALRSDLDSGQSTTMD